MYISYFFLCVFFPLLLLCIFPLLQYFATSIFVTCMLAVVVSQRPPYVPRPVRYPDVSPRFKAPESENVDIGNRNGMPEVSTTTIRLPVDARGNVDLVNQINTWPEERKPFWWLNREAIEASRARPVPSPGVQNVQPNVAARSSFLPSRK